MSRLEAHLWVIVAATTFAFIWMSTDSTGDRLVQSCIAATVLSLLGALSLALNRPPQSEESSELAMRERTRGPIAPDVTCLHCGLIGHVRMKRTKLDADLTSGTAAAAGIAGGISLLATVFSRKLTVTAAHCEHCGLQWIIA